MKLAKYMKAKSYCIYTNMTRKTTLLVGHNRGQGFSSLSAIITCPLSLHEPLRTALLWPPRSDHWAASAFLK